MKSVVRWSVDNAPALNVAMIALLAAGVWCMSSLQREFWPYYDLDEIEVRVVYPGASPEEIEEAICEKIESAVASVHGIDEINSIASEGSGHVNLVLDAGVSQADVQQILGDVRAAVDQIPSFPLLAEEPIVSQRIARSTAIQIGVIGPDDDTIESGLQLRRIAERVKDDLLRLDSISQVELDGVPEFQIDAELSQTVRAAYFGDEVMRLQRDRHKVELRVRYPSDQRDSLADFRQIRHRTADGHVFPIVTICVFVR